MTRDDMLAEARTLMATAMRLAEGLRRQGLTVAQAVELLTVALAVCLAQCADAATRDTAVGAVSRGLANMTPALVDMYDAAERQDMERWS